MITPEELKHIKTEMNKIFQLGKLLPKNIMKVISTANSLHYI